METWRGAGRHEHLGDALFIRQALNDLLELLLLLFQFLDARVDREVRTIDVHPGRTGGDEHAEQEDVGKAAEHKVCVTGSKGRAYPSHCVIRSHPTSPYRPVPPGRLGILPGTCCRRAGTGGAVSAAGTGAAPSAILSGALNVAAGKSWRMVCRSAGRM